ncbi:MAG: cell surface protein [Bacteroidales bacterium]|nr:cell surface protein [Bacteroidales bacterium]
MWTRITVLLVLIFLSFGFLVPRPGSDPVKLNLIRYNEASGRLLVFSETPPMAYEIDPITAKISRQAELPYNPSGAVFNKAGNRLYVAAGGPQGRILEIDPATLRLVSDYSSGGHTPSALAMSENEGSLFVCNRFSNEVVQIDLNKRRVVKKFGVLREPAGLVLAPDGRYLFAGNFLPAGRSDAEHVGTAVSVIDLYNDKVENIDLPNGSNSIGGMALSPDGRHIFVSHILARFQLPTTQIERGWMNTNAMSVIDVNGKSLLATVLLDDIDLGFPNPRALAFSSDGSELIISSFGGNEISLINIQALNGIISIAQQAPIAKANAYTALSNDLSTMHKVQRKRIQLPGYGPGSIAVAGHNAIITEYFSGTVSIVNLNKQASVPVRQVSAGTGNPFADPIFYGEMLFNSAELCFQQWQSCASCHPDARIDGLNWDLLNDGMGNPKKTKSMLYAHATPPSMSLGVRSTAEMAVRAGIRFIQFAAVDEEKASAIDMFLKSLSPVPSPYLVNNKLSSAAKRGQDVFNREGCGVCHPPPYYTDMKLHGTETGKGMDKGKSFDTPKLIEVWRTGPYMHDGSITNMEELIRIHNPYGKSSLSEKEIAELSEFVLSL